VTAAWEPFMGDKNDRYEDNVPGKWYVDKKCILCSVCSEAAPNNFKESSSGDHDFVYKQPGSSDEEREAEEAMAACPVEAIGNDGIL
jgi:ferredoxin